MVTLQELTRNLPIHNTAEMADAAKHNAMLAGGKAAAHGVGGAVTGAGAIGGISGFTLPVVGLTAAVSASITQIEYKNKMKRVAQFYREELGSLLKKDPKEITADDLEMGGKGSILKEVNANPVITEELNQSRRHRNLGVVLSVAASILTVALLGSAGMGLLAHSATAMIGVAEGGFLAGAVHSIIGLGIYYAIKTPMHWVGDRILGLNKETTHERIENIQRDREAGRTIGKEQVFAVYVAANPDIARAIRAQYRKSYDDLSLADKQRVTHNIGVPMGVEQVTEAINKGQMNVAELAYITVGQSSGASVHEVVPQEKKGIISKVKEKLHDVAEHITHHETPARSFADRIKRKSSNLTHLERLEQSRAAGPLATER